MFVACELQIGLADEIDKHRNVHVAYERDRILSNQPLLRNYDRMRKEGVYDDECKCTKEDNELIEKVLFGKIASEVLIPCTANNDDQNNMLMFKHGPFHSSWDEANAGSVATPERRCLNYRSLDCFVRGHAAILLAGPYKLDETRRYFVDSFLFKNSQLGLFGTVGLYAHVGPYMIQITCDIVDRAETEDIVAVNSGRNLS